MLKGGEVSMKNIIVFNGMIYKVKGSEIASYVRHNEAAISKALEEGLRKGTVEAVA